MPWLEGISILGLALALGLPWLVGSLGVRLLGGPRFDVALALGYGFFVGQLLVILMLLTWDAVAGNENAVKLAFMPMAILLALAASAMGGLLLRRQMLLTDPTMLKPWWRPRPPDRADWKTWLVVLALLMLVLLRFFVMAQEMAVRPVFAWDAWMNWAPRAVVWFHHLELTPFVVPPEWLDASADREVYTLGNWRASGYPPGVPLMLLWTMLGAGTHDHTLLFLPWLFAAAAFVLVLWGHLRAAGSSPIPALIAVYLFISIPLVDTHIMLVGYADLWLAFFFSLGFIAVDRVHRDGSSATPVGYSALAVLLALGCALMKTPGIVFGGLVLLGLATALLRPPEHWWARLVLAGLAVIAVGLVLGMMPDRLGGEWVLPLPMFLPDLRVQPQPLLPVLFESLFVFSNWHLLWLVAPLAGLAALSMRGLGAAQSPALAGLVAAAALLVFVFGFTHYFRQAENLLTLNRTMLYLVPLTVYLVGDWLSTAWRTGDA